MRSRARRLFLDTAPLRHDRDYRWLWSGQVVSGIGNQITRVALPFQVYVLTGSTLAIGALTLFQLVPILLFALGAGSLADAVDRRRLLMATQLGLAACSAVLTLLALSGNPPVVALFAVAFVAAGLGAVDQPTRSPAIPRLVPAERLPAAIALNESRRRRHPGGGDRARPGSSRDPDLERGTDRLERLGVEVRTGTRIVHIDDRSARVTMPDGSEQEIPARTVLWRSSART